MRHRNPDIRNQFAQILFHPGNIRNPRTNKKHLPAAILLPIDRFLNHDTVKRHDKRARRQTVNRRRGDNAELLNAGQRQLQSPRDRRCRQGQDMNVRLKLFQLFLMRNAKMLFLVNNQQAQIAKFDVFG